MNPIQPAPVRTITDSTVPVKKLSSEDNQLTEAKRQEEEAKYAAFNQFLNQDNYMTEAEFSKYIPLFSKENRNKIMSPEGFKQNSELVKTITELSQELYRTINVQRPLHITDNSGNILYSLPPMMRKLTLPRNREAFRNNIQAFVHHSEQSGENIISHNQAAYLSTVLSEEVKAAQQEPESTSKQDEVMYTYMADRFNIQKLIEKGTPIPENILLKYFPEYKDSPELERMVQGTVTQVNAVQKQTHHTQVNDSIDDWDDDDLFN